MGFSKRLREHLHRVNLILFAAVLCISMTVPSFAADSLPQTISEEPNVQTEEPADNCETGTPEDSTENTGATDTEEQPSLENPEGQSEGGADTVGQQETIDETNETLDPAEQPEDQTPAEEEQKPHDVFLLMGDSYASGAGNLVMGPTGSGAYWPDYLSKKAGFDRCYTYACGGIGFVSWWGGKTIPQLLLDAIADSAEGNLVDPEEVRWVIVAAGFNDWKDRYNTGGIYSQIVSFVRTAKKEFPNAKIAIGFVGWGGPGITNAALIRDRITTVVAPLYRQAALDSGALYIGNIEYLLRSHENLLGKDGVHPTSAGEKLIADYIAAFISNAERCVTEIDYYYPDGSRCAVQKYEGGDTGSGAFPVIDLGNGVKITGWTRDSRYQKAEYASGAIPQDWTENNGPYTQLYGVVNTDSSFTGFKKVGSEWWYFLQGKQRTGTATVVNATVNGAKDWWYVNSAGKLDLTYTGFAKNKNGWWYVVKGRVNFKKTDVVKGTINGKTAWYNIVHNKLTAGPTVAHNKNGWWYIDRNGKVDFGYTGFAKNKNGWWYVVKGKVDFKKNDVVHATINGKTAWYNIVHNKLTSGPAVAKNKNGWWYIGKGGKVNFSYNGTLKKAGKIYYFKKGKLVKIKKAR